MNTLTWGRVASATPHRGPARALGVAGAVAAAMAVWAITVPGLGVNLLIQFGSGSPQPVHAELVAGAALAASLCGWGLLAMLERRTRRALAIWTAVAAGVTAASLSLPAVAGVTAAAAAALAAMHLAVAAALSPALRRSAVRTAGTS
jgi:hypothetical protein